MQLTQAELNQHQPKQRPTSKQYFSPSKKQQQACRICLQELEESQIPDLCLCKGQNRLIHQKCMLEWMKRAEKYEEFPYTYFYLCDICKTRIYLDTQVNWSCKRWSDITFCGRSTCCTITSVFVFIIGLILIIESVILLKTSDLKELIIFGMVAGAIVIIVGMIFYVFQVLLQMELVIHGIAEKKKKRAKRNQIMPTHPEVYVVSHDSSATLPMTNQASHAHLSDYQH